MEHSFDLHWWSVLPFATILLCIAVFPLIHKLNHFWEHNLYKLIIALFLGIPVAVWMIMLGNLSGVFHALLEYSQFIILLLALFVISGGIFVDGDIKATPLNNSIFLGIGAVLASLIGTTGAAMLLLRPILHTNSERRYKTHTVVFAILIIANCGGLLTPLGDPPLFLGMLRGVPFFWTLEALWPMWLFVNFMLLISYFALDSKYYDYEPIKDIIADESNIKPISTQGKMNILLLLGVILSVIYLPSMNLHDISAGHASLLAYLPLREIVMLLLIAVSYLFLDQKPREKNHFSFHPILEVAALFIGIFLTMIPALLYLAQMAPKLPLNEITFFIFTGGLSSVLDNAPTYATFFEMAKGLGGEPSVAGVKEVYLIAISLGSVFCGAMTYIGNGPNFMVKAIAEHQKVHMPHFGEYIYKWTFIYLLPILTLMVLIFINTDYKLKIVGFVLTALLIGWNINNVFRYAYWKKEYKATHQK